MMTDLRKKELNLKKQINELEKLMVKEEQVDCPVTHRFGPGTYVREVFMPANTFAIGHEQKQTHLNVFIKGRVTVLNPDGTTSELKAPMTFIGQPGRKIGYVHEDVIWQNIYATDEQDITKLEETYLNKSEDWLSSDRAKRSINLFNVKLDRKDYEKVLKEYGFSNNQVEAQVKNESDQIELPHGSYKFKKTFSEIHGIGMCATANIAHGEIIGPARIEGKRTVLGRFINHSLHPNAEMIRGKKYEIVLIATKQINGCKGGQDGEEITVNYRQSLSLTMALNSEKGEKRCQQ